MSISIGDTAPAFSLPDTDGEEHALNAGGAPSVVVFTCNHCPYASPGTTASSTWRTTIPGAPASWR